MRKSAYEKPWNLIRSWMPQPETVSWENKLIKNLDWEQPIVRIFGNDYKVPRKTCFLAQSGISYSYSGYVHLSREWPSWIKPLLEKVVNTCSTNFNGCLINYYRDGNDSMGWHRDNESVLDMNKPIASLSLGSRRDFCLKHINKKFKELLTLNSGDLLIMNPPCQKEWLHSVPRRKKIYSSRINLTFRCYM